MVRAAKHLHAALVPVLIAACTESLPLVTIPAG